MPIEMPCPHCGETLRGPDSSAGKRVRCPGCQELSIFPRATAPNPPAAETVVDRPRVEAARPTFERLAPGAGWDAPPEPAPKPAPPPKPAPSPKPEPERFDAEVEDDDEDDSPAPEPAKPEPAKAESVPKFAPGKSAAVPVADQAAADPGNPLHGLPPEFRDAAMAELASSERLVWAGRPSPRVAMFRGLDRVCMACLYAGLGFFAVGGIYWAVGKGSPLPLLGVLMGAAWLMIAVSRVLARKKFAEQTVYLLTTQRAIVATVAKGRTTDVFSYPAVAAKHLQRADSKYYPDGGDVIFQRLETPGGFTKKGKPRPPVIELRGFLHVEPCREIEKLVRDTLHVADKPISLAPAPNPAAVTAAAKAAAAKGGSTLLQGFAFAAGLCLAPALLGILFAASGGGEPQLTGGGGFGDMFDMSDGKDKDKKDGESMRDKVLKALAGDDPKKRVIAAEMVAKEDPAKSKDPAPIAKALVPLLANPETREPAAKALAKWASPAEAGAIAGALKSDSAVVRDYALEAALRLTKEAKTADARQSLAVFAEPLFQFKGKADAGKLRDAIVSLGPPAEDAAREALGSNEAKTRVLACEVLGKVGTSKVLLSLGLKSQDSDPEVVKAAAAAAAAIKARGDK